MPVVDSGERREVQLREAQEAVGQDYGVLWCCLGGLAFRAVRIRLERDAEREREMHYHSARGWRRSRP